MPSPVRHASQSHPPCTVFSQAKRIPASALAQTDDEGGYVSDEDESAEMEDESVKANIKKKEEKLKLAKELSDLVIICQSVSFKSFEHSKQNRESVKVLSQA